MQPLLNELIVLKIAAPTIQVLQEPFSKISEDTLLKDSISYSYS